MAKASFGYDHLTAVGSGSKNNFIQIGVYFQSLNTKMTKEDPKYMVNKFTNTYINTVLVILKE
jgi:hypothetical protein